MPIKHVAGGYRWGEHGHVYATREGAEKQAEAAYAHGYAGDAATQGAGLLMCTPQGKALFLRRSDSAQDCAGMWDLPGGTADAGETPLDTARREAVEEIGDVPEGQTELLTDILADEVRFVTFLHMIKQEFAPDLNDEHSDHVWADLDNPPEPLHPGVRRTLAAMQAPKMAGDAEFKEGDHPRAENGQFGSGGSPTQSNQYDHEKIAKSLKLSGWNKGNIQEGKRHLYLGSTAAKQLALMAGYKMTRESDGRDVINASNNEFEIIGKQWLEKKEESRKNKAAFKEKQKQIAASKEKTKMAGDAEHWITAHPNSSGPGTPILIEGTEGGGYSIKGGAGGKLDGKSVQPKSMSVARLNEKTSQFGNPDFKPYEPPSKSTKEPASQKPLQRTYLRVPYAEKEFAKKHGAKWDAEKRSWFIPENKTLPVELQKYEQVTPEKKGQLTPEKKGTGTPVFVSDRSEAELNRD